jgi:hypothetical protein
VLNAVAEHGQQLFPLVNWAYAVPAELWVHDGPNGYELLWPITAVKQGGLLLFWFPPLEQIVRDFLVVSLTAYLDDAYLQYLQ